MLRLGPSRPWSSGARALGWSLDEGSASSKRGVRGIASWCTRLGLPQEIVNVEGGASRTAIRSRDRRHSHDPAHSLDARDRLKRGIVTGIAVDKSSRFPSRRASEGGRQVSARPSGSGGPPTEIVHDGNRCPDDFQAEHLPKPSESSPRAFT